MDLEKYLKDLKFNEFTNVQRQVFSKINTEKNILDNFNLSIGSGEIHAIMGPNGTGKSTLLKLMTKIYL